MPGTSTEAVKALIADMERLPSFRHLPRTDLAAQAASMLSSLLDERDAAQAAVRFKQGLIEDISRDCESTEASRDKLQNSLDIRTLSLQKNAQRIRDLEAELAYAKGEGLALDPDPHDVDWWRRNTAFWAQETERAEDERDKLAAKLEAIGKQLDSWAGYPATARRIRAILADTTEPEDSWPCETCGGNMHNTLQHGTGFSAEQHEWAQMADTTEPKGGDE